MKGMPQTFIGALLRHGIIRPKNAS